MTKTEIANMALGHLGSDAVLVNLDEDSSPESQAMSLYYEESKSWVFSDFNWRICRKRRVPLNQVDKFSENGIDYYLFAEPADFERNAEIFSIENGQRCKVRFDYYFYKDQRVYQVAARVCEIDYVFNMAEKDYPTMLGLLQSYKLAALARNQLTLGDSAISTMRLNELYGKAFDTITEKYGLQRDDQTGKITSTEEAMSASAYIRE